MDSNDLVLILKVQADQGAKIDDLSNKLDKLKKSSKESSDSFSIMDTKLGSMWKTFTEGVDKGVNSLKTFQGALAATGIGLLLIAVANLVQYFQTTTNGANIMKGVMSALGEAVREGPKLAFDALKIAFEVMLLPMRTFILIAGNMVQVLKGKESIKEAVENVKTGIETLKKEITDTATEMANMGKNIGLSYELGVKWEQIQQKIQADRVKEAEIETKIAELRDKAQEVKTSDLSADEKATKQLDLLNQAKELMHQKDKIALDDANAALVIAKEQLTLAPTNLDAIKKVQDAEIDIQSIKDRGFQDDKAIQRQKLGASQELIKAKQDEAKELAKINETILEDSLQGQSKEQAALDFKYKEDQEAAKNNNKLLSALNDKYIADSLALQKKYDDEQIKKDKETADKLYEQKQRDDKKALDDHKAIQDQLAKLNTKDQTTAIGKLTAQYNQERNSFKQLCDDKHATAQELAEGMQAINEAEANAKKKLRQVELEDYLAQAGSILQTASDLAGKSTVLGKATAIAGIIANAAQAEIKTFVGYADMPIIGEILAIAQAAMIGLSAAKSISQVEAVKAPAAQHLENGGLVGGNSYSGDKISLMGNTGEIMINNRATANPLIAQQALMLNNGQLIQHNSITEERVAEIVRQGIKSVPVVASQYRLDWTDQRVKASQGHFTV
jgi:hypothetical protein